ncbi:hypothetical protein D0T85_14560 [Bacteroides sp. 519]|nr:hypothetical protein [Bacteroides sp. 519]
MFFKYSNKILSAGDFQPRGLCFGPLQAVQHTDGGCRGWWRAYTARGPEAPQAARGHADGDARRHGAATIQPLAATL